METIAPKPKSIQRVYLTLMLFSTLATSFIWGVNTLFLLDAGLNNFEAFAANAIYSAAMVIFEVPTGVVADVWGRRVSYLLGTVVLSVSTVLYLLAWVQHSPFWVWAVTSAMLGLGFTFFSGATEAWLVDALKYADYKGTLEAVFAKGQVASGAAMLSGAVLGGLVAQVSNLGVPYILRAGALIATFAVAYFTMHDWGFKPMKGKRPLKEMKRILQTSYDHGLRNPPVKWIMLAGPFSSGVLFYGFYAMQPYLLQLYGNNKAYLIGGLAAAIVGGAQIAGGFAAPIARKAFKRRTSLLIASLVVSALLLLGIGLTSNFLVAVGLLILWGLVFALSMPVRQAYLNALIPSEQRATVLSTDNLISSTGGVVFPPALGRAADVYSYSVSYVISAAVQILGVPFIWMARRKKADSDPI